MATLTRLAVPSLLAIAATITAITVTAIAQESRTEAACDDEWAGGDRRNVHVCETREFTLTQENSVQIDGSPNGTVSVTGWDRNEIRIRAKIHTWDRNEQDARQLLAGISIGTNRVLHAEGPDARSSWWPFRRRNGGWNVSFEVMAPYGTDLWIESVNGRITVADMRGRTDVETVNGGISLTNVAASVRGRTVNGSISADLADDTVDGDILDLRTTNGRIVMGIPEDFSAKLDIATVNGRVSSDFPVTREGQRNREISATLGSGAAMIRARTVNGGVQIKRL